MDLEKKYKTGVLWQDLQHKELIDLINKISDPKHLEKGTSMYTYTVAFLVMYANHHFSLEEGYMDTYEYPEMEFHKKLHNDFIKILKNFREQYPTYSHEAAEILVKKLLTWILKHILDNDQKLGTFIKAKESKGL